MNPASKVIEKLGGEAVVAKVLETASTAPYRWQYSREKGGTNGLIPQRHHRKLLDFAEQSKISLQAEDFLPERETAQ